MNKVDEAGFRLRLLVSKMLIDRYKICNVSANLRATEQVLDLLKVVTAISPTAAIEGQFDQFDQEIDKIVQEARFDST